MALRGQTPKDKPSRPRDEKRRTIESTEVVLGSSKVKAPKLPEAKTMHARTRRWWKRWAESPQASLFSDTDWGRLEDLALIVDDFYSTGEPKLRARLMGEIRANESKLGATAEDRLRLRWKFRDPSKEPAGEGEAAGQTEKPKPRRAARTTDPRLRVVQGGE